MFPLRIKTFIKKINEGNIYLNPKYLEDLIIKKIIAIIVERPMKPNSEINLIPNEAAS